MESTTLDLYEKSMRTKRIPLSIIDFISLWMGPFFGFGLSMWVLYDYGAKLLFPLYFGFGMYLLPLVMWLLIAYGVYSNIRDCKFTFLVSKIPILEKEQVILRCQEKLRWKLRDKSRQYFRFQDRMSLTRWSNYVTIVWDENGYYVNSIDSRFRTVIFFGNRWKRVEEVIECIDSLDSDRKAMILDKNIITPQPQSP